MPKNKITNQSYFLKRLRDNGYYACRLYDRYGEDDLRKWTVMINPKYESVLITCYRDVEFTGRGLYEFNDGGVSLPKNFKISTDSMEVVVSYLKEYNVIGRESTLNNSNAKRPTKRTGSGPTQEAS